MSVLSREELLAALAADPPLVEDLDLDLQLQPNGIDIRVDRVARLVSRGTLGVEGREPAERTEVPDQDGWWDLAAGAYVIGYRERVNLPNDVMALAHVPDPDLVIRTGGEQRISNFLLWQTAYSEFYFSDKLWPEFDEAALDEAIASFNRRERRFGKTSGQLASPLTTPSAT